MCLKLLLFIAFLLVAFRMVQSKPINQENGVVFKPANISESDAGLHLIKPNPATITTDKTKIIIIASIGTIGGSIFVLGCLCICVPCFRNYFSYRAHNEAPQNRTHGSVNWAVASYSNSQNQASAHNESAHDESNQKLEIVKQ